MSQHHKTIQQHLALQILLADRLVKSAKEVESSKYDFTDVTRLATQLANLLRSTARVVAGFATTFYDRPFRTITNNVSLNLERAQTLVRKCKKRSNILRQVFAITTAADIRKVSNLLESSIGDIKWLVSIFVTDDNTGVNLSLPPIASNDPVLAWVWSNIAMVQHSTQLKDRVEAANSLGSLAGDNDRNKKMIIEEDGIPPLLKLLKEGASPESQIAAVTTLYNLATDQEKVSAFVQSMAVPVIVHVLNDSTNIVVRTNVINLVSRMAEMDSCVQEEFGRENVMRAIVTFLANDIVFNDYVTNIHSLARVSSEIGKNGYSSFHSSSSLSFYNKKETGPGSPEEKMKLKISCGRALWVLAKGSLLNSRKIMETKALICLAKLIEPEPEELQVNCLKTVMELATVAESNADLRRQAFKPNSPAARTVLDQLLRVVNHGTNPKLVVPAITTIGSLARTFPIKETRILGPLVSKLDHQVPDISKEAVMSLTKFVNPENFNCVEHSKAILEFDGVTHLMSFLKSNDNIRIQIHGLKLLCYLALHVGNDKALEQAQALSVIEGASRSVVTQYPEMKELLAKAIHHLNLYQAGTCAHKRDYVP
ncbi:Armadillo [Artemisia annua]|uniref:Armadillo n=1 Tax=Artemisia annua TaxID=35608 RepID=A0A2U1NGC8_ARTAN|nr:Armadillo [Artemisia annua]